MNFGEFPLGCVWCVLNMLIKKYERSSLCLNSLRPQIMVAGGSFTCGPLELTDDNEAV